MTKSRQAHAADPKQSIVRRILSTVGVFSTAIVLAVTATGGSYALWSDSIAVTTPSLTAGSAGLTINGGTDVTVAMTPARLYPGRSVVSAAPLTLKNTGTTPLSVTAAAPTFSSPAGVLAPYLTVAVRPATTCAPGPVGVPPTALPASMGAPVILPPAGETQLCLEVYLSASAPSTVQGTTAAFAVQLNGAQVPRL
jgi:hypothetical protein